MIDLIAVPVFDGRDGVDWSDIWKTPLHDADMPGGSFGAVGFTVTSYKHKEKDVVSTDAVGCNVQFAVWLS